MKIKKILCASLALILALQATVYSAYTAENNTAEEMENNYLLVYNEPSESGLVDYYYVDKNGNRIEFNEKKTSSSNGVNALNSTGNNLPTRYSLKDLGLVTPAKEQGLSNNCWAFSALGAIESNAMLQGKETPDYSEAHLVWFAINSGSPDLKEGYVHSNPYAVGGNWMFATAALTRWSGTVSEADYPFYPYDFTLMGNYSESERYNTSGGAIINSAETLNEMTEIKEWIMQNGAVETNIYMDDKQFLNQSSNGYAYYCNDESFKTNHAILVVGWDDYYKASNFKSSSKPQYPGAFLCKNSWGNDWGDDGYFWVSYFDKTISNFMGYICVDSDTYDYNYTYNGFGYGAAYKVTSSSGSQVANVFTSEGYEKLSAISTFTIQDNINAEIFVYKNLPSNYSKPDQGILVYSSEKIVLKNPGYHTVELSKSISLDPNEIFSIVIRFSDNSGSVYIVDEYNDPNGAQVYSSKARQSYIDTSGTDANWKDSVSYGRNNNCIQAFTVCVHQSYESTTPPTCESDGFNEIFCSQCGKQLSVRIIESGGHSMGEWKTTKIPTRTDDGEKERTCIFCDYKELQILSCLPEPTIRITNINQLFELIRAFLFSLFSRVSERF